jgi:hypothetical protein
VHPAPAAETLAAELAETPALEMAAARFISHSCGPSLHAVRLSLSADLKLAAAIV